MKLWFVVARNHQVERSVCFMHPTVYYAVRLIFCSHQRWVGNVLIVLLCGCCEMFTISSDAFDLIHFVWDCFGVKSSISIL